MKDEQDLYNLYHEALKRLAKVCGLVMTSMSPSDLGEYFGKDMLWQVMHDYVIGSELVNALNKMGEKDIHMGKLETIYPRCCDDDEILKTLEYPDKIWGYKK